jgi:hypothetical protein
MWNHPDATEKNIIDQFPEIFGKHDLLYFNLPGDRMSDFFVSANRLDASRKTKDLSDLFSAVQRMSKKAEYKDPFRFLMGDEQTAKLAAATSPEEVHTILTELADDYHDKYGMRRQVNGFYRDHLDETGRRTLLTKLPRPGSHKPGKHQDKDGELRVRVDFLLSLRDQHSHDGSYLPLPDANQIPLWHETVRGDPSSVWLISLTFEELYEITRKAATHLWNEEYEHYWADGGKELTERMVAEVQARCDELNRAAKNSA